MSIHSCVRFCLFSTVIAIFAAVIPARASVGFQPVSAEELKITGDPKAPGAQAIILYREVNRDDYGRTGHGGLAIAGNESAAYSSRYEEDYFRIKILTESGRKYGDIEIPLWNHIGQIVNINGRTIHPDGSIVPFDGRTFDKDIIKTKGLRYRARTFALPDVTVGSIIEYYYTINFNEGFLAFSQWILSNELFTKRAKFTLRPFHNDYAPMSFRWTEHLPSGSASPKEMPDGTIQLQAADIAAFRLEDYMPPQNELEARVDFIYSSDPFETDPAKFWKKVGKKRNDQLETFISRRAAVEQAVPQIVAASDAPEVKLQKLYARVQQLENTSFGFHKTAQELNRDNRKGQESVEDIWKQGHGDRTQLNWLYLAMVRAAGLEAAGVWVSDRSNSFFDPKMLQSGKLDRNVVAVKLNGKEVYVEPGAEFTPFGMLPWEETGVQGLRLDKDGGTWIQTTLPDSAASHIERKAMLKLMPDDILQGKVTVTYTGLEALRRRIEERNQDATSRKSFLEDQLKQSVPMGTDIELTNQPAWTNADAPLVAEFDVKIPGWATVAGHRVLFPVGLFGATERHVFEYSERVHPIYFEYLSQKLDDITIELPLGWQITSVPKPLNQDLRVVGYSMIAENSRGTLHLTRKFDINILSMEQKYYDPLRGFYQIVNAGDDQQVVLLPGTATSAN